jgi:hypothetical protein
MALGDKNGAQMITRLVSCVAAAWLLTSCVNTQVRVTAFTDPDFQQASYRRLIVAAPNLLPENAQYFESEMCKTLAPHVQKCDGASAMFPPTRSYSAEDIIRMLKASGSDAVLVLTLLSDQSSSQYVGTYATVNPYGTGLAVPLVRRDRGARASVQLTDIALWKPAWAGQIAVVGTGRGTSDASLISAGAHEIAAELKRVGRVGGPQ